MKYKKSVSIPVPPAHLSAIDETKTILFIAHLKRTDSEARNGDKQLLEGAQKVATSI